MSKLREAQARRLIQLYTDAERDILVEYNIALLKGNDLKNLTALRANVAAIRKDLLAGGRTWCEEVVPALYKLAADEVDKSLGSMAFGAIHQQAMQILAENAYGRFEDIDQFVGRRVNDVYRALALEATRPGAVGAYTWEQVAKSYLDKLAKSGVTGFEDKAGRAWNLKTYSEMVARTTTREVMINGTANRLLEHGQDLAEITGDSAENTCDICRAWVGRIVSLTGRTPGYPTLDEARGAGLFHGRCTHNIATAMRF